MLTCDNCGSPEKNSRATTDEPFKNLNLKDVFLLCPVFHPLYRTAKLKLTQDCYSVKPFTAAYAGWIHDKKKLKIKHDMCS